MRAEDIEQAGVATREADAALVAAVELVREAGYPMPEGSQQRTLPEIRLIGLAYDVRAAQRKAEMVADGTTVYVFHQGMPTPTNVDYWQDQVTQRKAALAHAAQHALPAQDGAR